MASYIYLRLKGHEDTSRLSLPAFSSHLLVASGQSSAALPDSEAVASAPSFPFPVLESVGRKKADGSL